MLKMFFAEFLNSKSFKNCWNFGRLQWGEEGGEESLWSERSMRVPRKLKNSGAVVAKKTSLLDVISDRRGITMAWIKLPLMTNRTSIESAVNAKM